MVAMEECPPIGRIVEKSEYRLSEEVEMPNLAAIVDENDRYIGR